MSAARGSPAGRIALFVLVGASTLWLGAVSCRAIIGNDMLKPGTLEFEEYLAPEAEAEIFRLLSITSIVAIAGYIVVLVSSTVFLATCPFRFREHGWLTMSALLFYIFVPVEVFTMYLDVQMIYQQFFTTADNMVFRELFRARLGALAGTPLIAHLCYYTIIGLAIFQPLRRSAGSPVS
jgi:hypothetical protein